MSQKICRTCLKKTYTTFKAHDNIHYPGEPEKLKISDMLRYLVPEIYLGVTLHPEICDECKNNLRSAYSFRKKCLDTENKIGAYLKKSRCNAATIELIDVLLFWEDKTKGEEQAQTVSELEEDKSQDLNEPKKEEHKTSENDLKSQKELTLSTELGVFVDKFGNCYNADGVSIANPKPIENIQTDFFQITDVYSLNEESDSQSGIEKDTSTAKSETCDKKQMPRITVIPEAKTSFTKPRITIIPEAKTDFMEPTEDMFKNQKKTKQTQPLSNTATGRRKTVVVKKPEGKFIPIAPKVTHVCDSSKLGLLPVIVDVRSECESAPKCDQKVDPPKPSNGDNSPVEIKKEPKDVFQKEDDEDTLSAGTDTQSNYDGIQDIIDSLPDTDHNSYVDIPEFVQINNFGLQDLDALRAKQQELQQEQSDVAKTAESLQPAARNSSPNPVQSPDSESDVPVVQSKQNLHDIVVRKRKLCSSNINPEGVKKRHLATGKPTVATGNTKQKIFGVVYTASLSGTTDTSTTALATTGPPRTPKIVVQSEKKCVVPKCPNSTELNPRKLFVWLPMNPARRSEWCKAIGIPCEQPEITYVCEDHFDLQNDMENWLYFKQHGGRMRLKQDAAPHRYLKEPIPHEMIKKSQMDKLEAGNVRNALILESTEEAKKGPFRYEVEHSDDTTNKPLFEKPSIAAESGPPHLSKSPLTNTGRSKLWYQKERPSMEKSESSVHKKNKSIPRKNSSSTGPYTAMLKDENLQPASPRKRRRRYRIVNVDPQKSPIKQSKPNFNDVCVLFTNYTNEGVYVNDHDYLDKPYERYKILFRINDKPLCMCFICGSKHGLDEHMQHMNQHESTCEMCRTDLGSAYMLNMHVRFHTYKCSLCSQKVIYGDMNTHKMMHMEENVIPGNGDAHMVSSDGEGNTSSSNLRNLRSCSVLILSTKDGLNPRTTVAESMISRAESYSSPSRKIRRRRTSDSVSPEFRVGTKPIRIKREKETEPELVVENTSPRMLRSRAKKNYKEEDEPTAGSSH